MPFILPFLVGAWVVHSIHKHEENAQRIKDLEQKVNNLEKK